MVSRGKTGQDPDEGLKYFFYKVKGCRAKTIVKENKSCKSNEMEGGGLMMMLISAPPLTQLQSILVGDQWPTESAFNPEGNTKI